MSEQPPPTNQEVFQQPPQKLESASKEAGFDIPIESVALPSKGVLYSMEHPLSNETHVDIRCMTAREEDLLTSRALIKNGTVMSKLMGACLTNKMINPDDLLIGDRNALLIAIRVTGYGPEYSVKISCPECNEEFENDFSLNGLKIKSLGAQPLQPNMNLFSYRLPLSGLEVQFKLLTGKDEAEMSKVQDRKKKLGGQVENIITSKLFHSIVSVNGETDRQKISYIVNSLRAGDARALRKHINDISPDVDMKQFATCGKCGEESEVEIPLGISFFWPDISD
jgi:hypothetical protein